MRTAVGLVGLGAVGEQAPAAVLDRDRAADLGLEVVDDVLQVGHAETLRCRRWWSSSVPGSAGWPPRTSCASAATRCSCSRPSGRAPGSRRAPGGSSGSRTATSGCARSRSRRATAGGAGSASSACTLLGDEGLVVTNGMWAGGEPLDRDEITRAGARCCATTTRTTPASGTRSPAACAASVAIAALAARVEVRRATVTAVDDGGVWAASERIDADAVIVCAGLGTQALIDPLGLDLELTTEPHTRVTYAGTGRLPDLRALLRAAHRRAATRSACTTRARSRTMFDLGEPDRPVECVSLFAPWLDHGDGFTDAARRPRDRARREQRDEVRAAARRPARGRVGRLAR